jgi:hypothetical protein
MLRRRLRENMRIALGDDVPARAESLYFRQLGWFLSSSLSTFHYGIAATSVLNEVKFDESIRLFDDAVSEGAVLSSHRRTGQATNWWPQ